MNSLVSYLKSHRLYTGLFSLAYYLLVVLPHEEVGKFIAKTMDVPLGRKTYNVVVLIAGITLLLVFLAMFKKALSKLQKIERQHLIKLLFIDLLLIVASINVLMVVNIEIIHIVQYGIMAILLFSLVQDYFETLFLATLLGVFDELYQYVYLAPLRTDYYDFNDVIINFSGVVLGLIFVRSLGQCPENTYLKVYERLSFKIALVLALIILLGWCFHYVSFYPDGVQDKGYVFEFIRKFKPGFWREIPPRVSFHVVQPLEGLIILITLFIIFRDIAGPKCSENGMKLEK